MPLLKAGDSFIDRNPSRRAQGVQFQVVRFFGDPSISESDQKLLDKNKNCNVGDIVYIDKKEKIEMTMKQLYADQHCKKVTGRRDPLGI